MKEIEKKMCSRGISLVMLGLLLLGTFALSIEIRDAKAVDPIYIRIMPDGSVVPSEPNIQRNGNIYTLTGDLNQKALIVLKDGITFDGNNKQVKGLSDRIGIGINLTGRKNVMVKKVNILWFQVGILLNRSSKSQLYHNVIFDGKETDMNSIGIRLLNSNNNTLFQNKVHKAGTTHAYHRGISFENSNQNKLFNSTMNDNGDNNNGFGIRLSNSSYNEIFDIKASNNHDGIGLEQYSHNNIIRYSNITENGRYELPGMPPGGSGEGIGLYETTSYNTLKYNNVVYNFLTPNGLQINVVQSYNNTWDGGYPSGGNYHFTDYTGVDSDGDGIGDTPHVIDGATNNVDRYPRVIRIPYTYRRLTIEAVPGGTTDPVPETYPYPYVQGIEPMQVTVTATPSQGYLFANWTLNGQVNYSNPITVTMNSNHTLKAWFTPYAYLTIQTEFGGTTNPPPGTHQHLVGTNVTVTAIPTEGSTFYLWNLDGQQKYDNPITVTMNVNHTLRAFFDSGGGCPYVYAWNGTQYVLDNNILPSSELSNGTDVQDYYMLEQTLVSKDGKYSLLISEFEQEHSYIDQVTLLAIDHDLDVKIAVTPDGQILTYKNPNAPLSAVDNHGNNRLGEIGYMDGNVSDPATYFYGVAGDYLILNFGRVNSRNAKLILRDDMKCVECCIDVHVLDRGGQWQTVTTVAPRSYWAVEGVDLSTYVVKNQEFKVRLLWTSPHRLDYVGLDTSKQEDYETTYATLVSATHSTQGDVKALLTTSDNIYAELTPGQQIQLDFTLPNNQKQARTYILYTEGHYYTIP